MAIQVADFQEAKQVLEDKRKVAINNSGECNWIEEHVHNKALQNVAALNQAHSEHEGVTQHQIQGLTFE